MQTNRNNVRCMQFPVVPGRCEGRKTFDIFLFAGIIRAGAFAAPASHFPEQIMSDIQTITLDNPYQIPKMGTSGLRLTQEAYGRPGFLEQFAQGIADYFREETDRTRLAKNNKTLLLGVDPRQGNAGRIKIIAGFSQLQDSRSSLPKTGWPVPLRCLMASASLSRRRCDSYCKP